MVAINTLRRVSAGPLGHGSRDKHGNRKQKENAWHFHRINELPELKCGYGWNIKNIWTSLGTPSADSRQPNLLKPRGARLH